MFSVVVPLMLVLGAVAVGPVEASHGSGVLTAVDVAAGGDHTCVLLSTGNVDCYGRNDYGQSADYLGGDALGIAAGRLHTCVLLSTGNVDCYGYNYYGQAADYLGGDAVGVAAGNNHSCVLLNIGDVNCYGDNWGGQSKDYTSGDAVGVAAGESHTCVLTSGGNVDCYGRNWNGAAEDYLGGDAAGVAAGDYHTCALLYNGNVDCHGYNNYGQANDYTYGDAVGVAVDGYIGGHTCVLTSGGNVICYGANHSGQSYDYTSGNAVGVAAGRSHTCVLTSNGDVGCYGANTYGQSEDWFGDSDGDEIHNDVDNCPITYNPDQTDMDGDGVGDECDVFPTDPSEWNDSDGDGVGGNGDNCPTTYNPAQEDTDEDGHGDACASVLRNLLYKDNLSIVPAVPLPPGDVVMEDYGGSEPITLVGSIGSVVVYDRGEDVCIDVVGEEQPLQVACVDRDRLGPADPFVTRGTMPLGPVGIPGTSPQEVPDISEGEVGSTPNITASLDVSYHYDVTRLNSEATLLGHEVWSPAGPGSEMWYLTHGDEVDLFVTMTVYEDGNEVESRTVSVPFVGQALAAAEKTAGTL